MVWDKTAEEKFGQMLAKMPVFMRPMAEKAIREKAENIVLKESRPEVTEKDMVDALFSVTPFGFQGLMKNDLNAIGIDYTKYGYTK